MRVISLAVLILLGAGCATPQIQCHDDQGQITYIGTYDEERKGSYVKYVNAITTDYYGKKHCSKIVDQKEASG